MKDFYIKKIKEEEDNHPVEVFLFDDELVEESNFHTDKIKKRDGDGTMA